MVGAALPLVTGIGAGVTAVGAGTVAAGLVAAAAVTSVVVGTYDHFVNPDGIVYDENGIARDHSFSARTKAALTGKELDPLLGQDRFEMAPRRLPTPAELEAAGQDLCAKGGGAGAVGAGLIAHNSREKGKEVQHTAATAGAVSSGGVGAACDPGKALKGAAYAAIPVGVYKAGEQNGKSSEQSSPAASPTASPTTPGQTPPTTESPTPEASPTESPTPIPEQTPGN